MLGGGLLPGTLTVVVGSTGIGKTQLGLQFAQAGLTQEGRRGIIFDMTARGDSQSHADYAAADVRLAAARQDAERAGRSGRISSMPTGPAAITCTSSSSGAGG